MTILISGGHLTPAIAFIDYLAKHQPSTQVVFAGRLHTQQRGNQTSQEPRLISDRSNTTFEPFSSGKWGTGNLLDRLLNLMLFLASLPRAFLIFRTHQPDIFLSFGGYLAVPLALTAKLRATPIITHEQTRAAGWANQIIARFAHVVALSYPESKPYFKQHQTVITGSLLRSSLFEPAQKPSWFKSKTEKPLLYITGGSQGSEIINSTVGSTIKQVLKSWSVIHQCGPDTKTRQYQHELESIKDNLPAKIRQSYQVRTWINQQDLAWIYQEATGVVSRAGANTTAELLQHHLPSVLIPLPFARNQEQQKNAQYLAQLGGSIIIEQKDLSSSSLQTALDRLLEHHRSMKQQLKTAKTQQSGAKKLLEIVEQSVK